MTTPLTGCLAYDSTPSGVLVTEDCTPDGVLTYDSTPDGVLFSFYKLQFKKMLYFCN